jgi:hypothetical protein
MVRHGMLIAAAVGGLIGMAGMAAATCPPDTFGAGKRDTCQPKCASGVPPDEIARMSRGVYAESVGLFANDGLASWLAVDIDRREIVEVRRFAGPHVKSAPPVSAPDANHYRREVKADRQNWIEVVRKTPVTPASLEEIVCLANALWAAGPTPPAHMSDMHNALLLVDRDTDKKFGGPGELTDDAFRLRRRLEALRDTAWR